jgi:hypothetical protein
MGGWASRERVLAELGSEETRCRLKKLACRQVPEDAAEDLVHQAIAVVLDTSASAWRPAEKNFLSYVGSILNGIAANTRRSAQTRREVLDDDLDARPPDSSPNPESALDRKRMADALQRNGERLYDVLDPRDEIAIRILQAARAGCDGIEEMSIWIGCTTEAVVAGIRRLRYRATLIKEEARVAEHGRMQQLPPQAARKGLGP